MNLTVKVIHDTYKRTTKLTMPQKNSGIMLSRHGDEALEFTILPENRMIYSFSIIFTLITTYYFKLT